MKTLAKIIVYILFISTSTTLAFAQTTRGQWMVGGSAYIDPSRYMYMNINPTAGYMISENFAVGTMLQIGFSNYDRGYSFNNYLVPTVRYYFGKSKTQPFLMAGFGIGQSSRFYSDDNYEDRTEFSYYGGGALGVSHFINENIALEFMVGYSNSPITKFAGTFVNFGFQIFLNKKSHEEE